MDLLNYSSVNQITATCYLRGFCRLRSDTSMEIITQAFWPPGIYNIKMAFQVGRPFSAGGESVQSS